MECGGSGIYIIYCTIIGNILCFGHEMEIDVGLIYFYIENLYTIKHVCLIVKTDPLLQLECGDSGILINHCTILRKIFVFVCKMEIYEGLIYFVVCKFFKILNRLLESKDG